MGWVSVSVVRRLDMEVGPSPLITVLGGVVAGESTWDIAGLNAEGTHGWDGTQKASVERRTGCLSCSGSATCLIDVSSAKTQCAAAVISRVNNELGKHHTY